MDTNIDTTPLGSSKSFSYCLLLAFSFIPCNPGALEPGHAPQTALWQRPSAIGPSVSESAGAFEGRFDSDLDAQGQAWKGGAGLDWVEHRFRSSIPGLGGQHWLSRSFE